MGTVLGSSMVFILKKDLNLFFEKLLIGFSSGIMLASSIWSLIIPALEITENNILNTLFCGMSLIIGIISLLILEILFPSEESENSLNFKKIFSVITLHNIPEGIVVGVCFVGAMSNNIYLTVSSALLLSIGISIQNIPEGSIVSIPYFLKTKRKIKAFNQ